MLFEGKYISVVNMLYSCYVVWSIDFVEIALLPIFLERLIPGLELEPVTSGVRHLPSLWGPTS